jgi:hypothetical protein
MIPNLTVKRRPNSSNSGIQLTAQPAKCQYLCCLTKKNKKNTHKAETDQVAILFTTEKFLLTKECGNKFFI